MCYFPKLFSCLPFSRGSLLRQNCTKSAYSEKKFSFENKYSVKKKSNFKTVMFSFFQTTSDIWDKSIPSLQVWPELSSLVSVCSYQAFICSWLPPSLHFPSPFPEKLPAMQNIMLSAASLAQPFPTAPTCHRSWEGEPALTNTDPDFQELQSLPSSFFKSPPLLTAKTTSQETFWQRTAAHVGGWKQNLMPSIVNSTCVKGCHGGHLLRDQITHTNQSLTVSLTPPTTSWAALEVHLLNCKIKK